MLHTYGPSPALFAEADPSTDDPTAVPPRLAGEEIPVRNAATGEALAPALTAPGGYITYSVDDVPAIQIETKTWNGTGYDPAWITLYSNEAQAGWDSAKDVAQAANATAARAETKADQALANAIAGGVAKVNGVGPDETGSVTLTAANVGARSAATPVPAADVSGLDPIATSGNWSALKGTIPSNLLQTSDMGKPSRLATLGADGILASSQRPPSSGGGAGYQPVEQNPDGTWGTDPRPTNDDVKIEWNCYDWSKPPALVSTGRGGMRPGDVLNRIVA